METNVFLDEGTKKIFSYCKENDFKFVKDGKVRSSSEADMREEAMSFFKLDSTSELIYGPDPFEESEFDEYFNLLSDEIKTGHGIYAIKNSDGTFMCLSSKIDDVFDFLDYAKLNGFIDELAEYKRIYPSFPDDGEDYSDAIVLKSKDYICIDLGCYSVFSLYPRPDFNVKSALKQELAGPDY